MLRKVVSENCDYFAKQPGKASSIQNWLKSLELLSVSNKKNHFLNLVNFKWWFHEHGMGMHRSQFVKHFNKHTTSNRFTCRN